jgi:hypothetical protein
LESTSTKVSKSFLSWLRCAWSDLLVKDIFAATKNTNGKYPDGYPFEDLLNFVTNCKDVVSFFHNHYLTRHWKAEKLKNLVQPAPTRWGTILGCFKSL